MNPALPVLLLLALGGWWVSRRRLGAGVLGAALAGAALLLPALALPDGIPSPAADLATLPPWSGVGDGGGGNPLLRDVTFQIQPWLLYLREQLRHGRLPWWNPHQLAGTPFWANGQSAPLFPLHLLFVALPLQLGFVLLPWLRSLLAGTGAFLLARRLGCSREAALLAAVIFPASGMLASFLLYPMGNALALVPWVLWAAEGVASGVAGWPILALCCGVQLLGGHPETSIHTALLSAVFLAVRGTTVRAWVRWLIGWAAGASLAAVQLLPLAVALLDSTKWAAHGAVGDADQGAVEVGATRPPIALLLAQPLRLVLPQLYGHPAQGSWWGPFNYSATAVYCGALALPLAAVGLARLRGDRRWLAVATMTAFSLLAAYHLPGVWDVLAALPLLGRVAHHRLLFGVELGVALLAAAGLDRWLEGRARRPLVAALLVAAAVAGAWTLYGDEWRTRGQLAGQAAWSAWALATAIAACLLARRAPRRRLLAAAAVAVVALVELAFAHGRINPGLPLARLYPVTGAVAFLQRQTGRVAGIGETLRPNAAMVYGLADLRGDDPVKLLAFERMYGHLAAAPDPVYFQPLRSWQSPWQDRLALRWVMAAPNAPPPVSGWQLAYDGADARVFRRTGAASMVRWQQETAPGGQPAADRGGPGRLRILGREPGLWRIGWRSARGGRVVVAETAAAGWSATIDGARSSLAREHGLLLAVDVPPGGGIVELRYRPPGIATGLTLSLVAVAAVSLAAARGRRRGEPG